MLPVIREADGTLLLAHVLGKDRAWLVAHPDASLTPEQHREYDALRARRAWGEPLAYITGEAWFYGRPFIVNSNVLIPRPETEHLVDEALAFLRERASTESRQSRPVVLDVGTGCGAIACTIAAEAPNATVYATDRSPEALAVARANVEGSAIRLELADLLPTDASLRFDVVVANLPYIPTADIPQKPNPVGWEPREALDGGPDGLREYGRLLGALRPRIHPGALVLLEGAPPTIEALCALAASALATAELVVGRDYAGKERFIKMMVGT